MDALLLAKALIMGVVEGLTEFLPVSSTGHLILAGDLLGFMADKEKRDVFEIFIQLGAILAVVWEYRRRFADVLLRLPSDQQARQLLVNLIVAFVPIAVLGLLFHKHIKAVLFHPVPVALAFIVGGLIILWAEKRQNAVRVAEADDMDWRDALKVGMAQCFGLIPGMSRSGSTIIGGLLFGLSRRAATEFSFFLAVPVLSSASLYSLWKVRHALTANDAGVFAAGFIAAALSGFVMVKALLRFIATHTFIAFAWYRIAFGVVVLITAHAGLVSWVD
ncbi:undecaprenyl-diphosphate phosphatase [Chitinimonas sp.]|uniref:undecaprenyl-diphosphate phosphatase n=1 Tax=Chitinimonas sp. TaxID=1934313 RepID=UPI0035B33631